MFATDDFNAAITVIPSNTIAAALATTNTCAAVVKVLAIDSGVAVFPFRSSRIFGLLEV